MATNVQIFSIDRQTLLTTKKLKLKYDEATLELFWTNVQKKRTGYEQKPPVFLKSVDINYKLNSIYKQHRARRPV